MGLQFNKTIPNLNSQDLLPKEFIDPYLADVLAQAKILIGQAVAEGLTPEQIQSIVEKALEETDVVTQSEFDLAVTNTIAPQIATIESAVSTQSTDLNELNFWADNHQLGDDARWTAANKSISDLRAELKQFVVETYAGTTPTYDYSQRVTILMAGGLVNLADQGAYTIQTNGAIQAQVGGLLGAGLTVSVNDSVVWTAPLNLLVPLNSPEMQVNAGDSVSFGGVVGLGQTIEVDFFPNKGT